MANAYSLDRLMANGWAPLEDCSSFPCDACGAAATFVRLGAPDCNITCLAGVGGAFSDVFGIYCSTACNNVLAYVPGDQQPQVA